MMSKSSDDDIAFQNALADIEWFYEQAALDLKDTLDQFSARVLKLMYASTEDSDLRDAIAAHLVVKELTADDR